MTGSDDMTPRPDIDITNAATAGEWVRTNVGSGVLSGYFYRDGKIVHTPREGESGYIEPDRSGDSDGPAQVRMVDAGHVAATVNYQCAPYKVTKSGGPAPARLTVEVAKDVVARPDLCPSLRPLRRVTHTPIVRADGSILTTPGYDAATCTYYMPPPDLFVHVADDPSASVVTWARGLLLEMLDGFRWAGPDDLTNYLGLLLTPLLGELVPPPYKLCVISAPQPGSGKTLLAQCARILHGGVFRSEMPEDDAELRKQVSAILDTTTGPIVCIDNVTGVLRSSTLSGLLTSAQWDDRRLGSAEVISRANNRIWTLTGNNVTLGGDLARRTLWVTIDPGVPHPERRTGFAIQNLEGWVTTNRSALLMALLTLVRAWHRAGRPIADHDRSDIYASWRAAVGGILANAGIGGTFDSSASAQQEIGGDDDEWRDLLAAIHDTFGSQAWTVRDLLGKVNTNGAVNDIARPIQLDALPADLSERVERSAGRNAGVVAKSLGRWLMNRRGRWAGIYCVRDAGSKSNSKLWRVELNPPNQQEAWVWGYNGFGSQTYARENGIIHRSLGGKPPEAPNPRGLMPDSMLMSDDVS